MPPRSYPAPFLQSGRRGPGTKPPAYDPPHRKTWITDGNGARASGTLDRSAGYPPYRATLAFWQHRGFVEVDTIDPLPGWQPGNPAHGLSRFA